MQKSAYIGNSSKGKKEEVVVNAVEEEKESKKDVKDYCPHIETLVVNSLIACIKDPNILVIKTALDFLYKYLPLKT